MRPCSVTTVQLHYAESVIPVFWVKSFIVNMLCNAVRFNQYTFPCTLAEMKMIFPNNLRNNWNSLTTKNATHMKVQ